MLSNSQTQSHSVGDVSKQARALTGSVTKLLDNFGFIDDSVFFQLSVVKGGDVSVGDKVYCECSYSEHLPFKWNATKVHLVQTNTRGTGSQVTQSGPQSQASQVATTYLQHRLQQQQQSREESVNPMAGIANTSHNYYSSQSSNPSYASQQSFDFSKAQEAVVAAQTLSGFYGNRNDSAGSFSQLQYTSTPGSAFVSSTLPFTQQIQQNLLSTQPRTSVQNSYKSSASRWEREERNNRTEDRIRPREVERSRLIDRKRNGSRDREGRDEFGRDLRAAEKTRERERERIERERERRYKRSESPNSINSQNVLTRAPRRRYEMVNIPKLAILKSPLNVYDIKQRYSAGLHVPSDFKEVVVNSKFSLNINDIPKPITFRVIESKDKKKESKESPKKSDSPKESKEKDNKSNDKNETKEDMNENKVEVIEVDDSNHKTETKEKTSSVDQPISSKQTYKYGVKVLILSLPSISDIYDRIFGSDFDAISTGSKSYFLHFNKLLAFLVSRNSNDGFSLIGGKFSAHSDGYLPDSEEPNLIATAIRVVGEQTGMNLSKCGKWRLIATFVYNRDNSVNPMTPNLELTRVYMPDVWSAFDGIYDKLNLNLENDNQMNENVLTNDNSLENNSEVVITSDPKKELISAEDNNNTECSADTTSNSLPEDSHSLAKEVEPSTDSNSALITQKLDSEPMDSTVPIVDTTPAVDSTSLPSDAIELTSAPIDSSDQPIVDLSAVDNRCPEANDAPNEDSSTTAPEVDSNVANTSVTTDDPSVQDLDTTGDLNSDSTPAVEKTVSSGDASELQQLLLRINDLKVAELRAQLEKRGARLKGNLKKADLISKLRQIVTQLLEDEDIVSDDNKNDWWAQRILSKESSNEDNDVTQEENTIDDIKQEDNIDEAALLGEDTNESAKEVESNDVVMADTPSESQDCIEITEQSDQQMVVDLTDDKSDTNTDNKDNGSQVETQSKDKEEAEQQKPTQNGTVKRKGDSQSLAKEPKKAKNGSKSPTEETVPEVVIPTKVVDGCVFVKGSENLTVITLHEALNHQRYDQFEMSIVSELIRESLIHHFSHYILSTLVENHKNPVPKEDKPSPDSKITPLPVNYNHLSFAFFDSSHCGHILSEDLAKLLNNANFTLSRRAFGLLVSNEDKVLYRDLSEPKELIQIKSTSIQSGAEGKSKEDSTTTCSKIYENNGTVYDIEKLIEQSESDEKLKVRLNEELVTNSDKICQLNEYIQELEGRQKKLTTATEKQNDEICGLKREREVMKTKYDSMRKTVETSVLAFNKVLENTKEDENK